jgi:hypothetical protein
MRGMVGLAAPLSQFMDKYAVEKDADGLFKVYLVKEEGFRWVLIAKCKDQLWADRIVNALNQMEIES